MPAAVLDVAKSKPVNSKAVPASVIPAPPENTTGVARDGALDEIRRAYRQLVGRFRRDEGKAPEADSDVKAGGATGDE